MALLRLDKLVSFCTGVSRKEVRALIRDGRISVAGAAEIAADMKVDTEKTEVFLDSRRLVYEQFRYLMMNKPAGYVSSTDDPRDKTVLDLLPGEYSRFSLFCAGRLDKDSEGLLILTDDGTYCHNVISPKKNVFKKYYCRVSGMLCDGDAVAVAEGMTLPDGTELLPGRLEQISESECFIYIREGKYHQVKRMLSALGKPVTYLKRLKIGSLELDPRLEKGSVKKMTYEEAALVFVNEDYNNCIN